jgi:hypothetical protein
LTSLDVLILQGVVIGGICGDVDSLHGWVESSGVSGHVGGFGAVVNDRMDLFVSSMSGSIDMLTYISWVLGLERVVNTLGLCIDWMGAVGFPPLLVIHITHSSIALQTRRYKFDESNMVWDWLSLLY